MKSLLRFFLDNSNSLRIIAGIIIILFSLQLIGIINFKLMNKEIRFFTGEYSKNLAFPLIVGAAFGFGWTPCIGPILGSILTLAALENSMGRGILLLSFGGDYLVKGSSSLARKLNISPMIIGIVIIGFGTSVPEIFVASNAVINNSPNIALGSVVGSNIANILLVFGFALVITKNEILKSVSSGDMTTMIVVTILLSLCLLYGSIGFPLSLIMVLLLPVYFYLSYKLYGS